MHGSDDGTVLLIPYTPSVAMGTNPKNASRGGAWPRLSSGDKSWLSHCLRQPGRAMWGRAAVWESGLERFLALAPNKIRLLLFLSQCFGHEADCTMPELYQQVQVRCYQGIWSPLAILGWKKMLVKTLPKGCRVRSFERDLLKQGRHSDHCTP